MDASQQGIGITGYLPCEPGKLYELALLHLPEQQDQGRLAEFDAECVWSRQISGAHYVSGFELREVSGAARTILEGP